MIQIRITEKQRRAVSLTLIQLLREHPRTSGVLGFGLQAKEADYALAPGDDLYELLISVLAEFDMAQEEKL